MKSWLSCLAACLVVIGLSACTDSVPSLPDDVQTVSGVLVPTDLSRTRRGTHIFLQQSKKLYYAESKQYNLAQYEYTPLTLTGTLELNHDPSDLPVLVIGSIVHDDSKLTDWEFEEYDISLRVSNDWDGKQAEHQIEWFLKHSSTPIASIAVEPLADDTTFQQFAGTLSGATLRTINRRQALEVRQSQTGHHLLYFDGGNSIVRITYAPITPQQAERQHWAFEGLLRSLTLANDEPFDPIKPRRTTTKPTSDLGGIEGRPCGGAAGIICPGGYFCSITDFAEGIGNCKRL